MNRPSSPIPVRPDYSAARSRASSAPSPIARAAAQYLVGISRSWDIADRMWADDRPAAAVLKAATAPASTTTSGWASTLAATGHSNVIAALSPASASASLLSRGLQFEFQGRNAIKVPNLAANAAYADWVVQGAPIPVRQFSVAAGPTLEVRKLAVIAVFTRECLEYTTVNVENVVRTTLAQSVGLAADAVLLGTAAGDTAQPAGLLFGISATTASTTTPPFEAMRADVAALVGAVSSVAGNDGISIVASPAQAAALRLAYAAGAPFTILASSALAAGTAIAVAAGALASASSPVPRFDTTRDAVLHMSDTPSAISTVGTPTTVAAPARSLYQSDTIGLRCILEVSWGLIDAAGIAWMQSVTW